MIHGRERILEKFTSKVIFWLLSYGEKKKQKNKRISSFSQNKKKFSQPFKLEIYFSIAAGTVCKATYFDSI